MERTKQVAGGILLGVTTVVVVGAAIYALWLGAPLLNPGVEAFGARDIPIITTDAQIVRPIPPTQVSPRAGVLQPAPATKRPTATTVSHSSSSRSQLRSTASRSSASASRSTSKPAVVASSRTSVKEAAHPVDLSGSSAHSEKSHLVTETD